jgi:ABC-type glycerol-3-phosphate transport system permease component
MIDLALRTPGQAFDSSLITRNPTFANFAQVLQQPGLGRYFLNSAVVAISTTIATVVIGILASYAFSRLRVPLRSLLFPLLLAQMFVPLAALLIPLTQLLKFLGLVNTYWGLIGPYTAIGLPFSLIVFKSAMDGFPQSLEEAARVDGASSFRTLVRIIVPLVRPATLVVAIWQFLFSWNEFFLALVIVTAPSVKTLPLAPLVYQGDYLTNLGDLFAILTLMTVVPILLYAVLQRSFLSGLMQGGVKE